MQLCERSGLFDPCVVSWELGSSETFGICSEGELSAHTVTLLEAEDWLKRDSGILEFCLYLVGPHVMVL